MREEKGHEDTDSDWIKGPIFINRISDAIFLKKRLPLIATALSNRNSLYLLSQNEKFPG
jgi:hypothetical protein